MEHALLITLSRAQLQAAIGKIDELVRLINDAQARNGPEREVKAISDAVRAFVVGIVGPVSELGRQYAEFTLEAPPRFIGDVQVASGGHLFARAINDLFSIQSELRKRLDSTSVVNRVFLVHGQDYSLKEKVDSFLSKIGIDVHVLERERTMGSETIIGKFEREAGLAAFAVVLLTMDDEGRRYSANSKKGGKFARRPRQNVIFELGYFHARLGKDCVCALYSPEANAELPSDYAGVIYIKVDDGPGSRWRRELADRLEHAGLIQITGEVLKHIVP